MTRFKMAGAYAKEFEKWLKQGPAADNNSVDMEDSGDEVDDYQMECKETAEGEIPAFNSLNESGQSYFLDEPPILEPVLHSLDSKKLETATEVHKEYDVQEKDSNSVLSQFNAGSDEVQFFNQKGSTFSESEKLPFNKMKDSENIFDKFGVLSEGDDFPPPLIPSHEAHLTTVDAKDDDSLTEKSYTTLQNLSPNFCAMEADSTSEMLKGDPQNTSVKDCTSKFGIGKEIAVECDSTCMLGSSPNVVSPDSISNIESDNLLQTPSQDESIFSEEISWCGLETQEKCSVLGQSGNEKFHAGFDNDYVANKILQGSDVQDSVWDRECPKLEAVTDVTDGKAIYQCKRSHDVDDPPVLSVISQALKSPSIAARKKRHTIDSVQSVKKRKQKSHRKESGSKKSKWANPAQQQQQQHQAPYNISTHDNELSNKSVTESFSSVKTEDRLSHAHSSHHSHPRKRRHKRRQTLPIVDLTSYGGHLPRDLHCFVVDSSHLSDLHNRMHRLLSLLFPQLSAELSAMSPESSRFESLLSDLSLSLQEYESRSNEKASEEVPASHSNSQLELNRLKTVKSDATHSLSEIPSNPSSFSFSSCASTQICSSLDSESQSCVDVSKENDSHRQSEFDPIVDSGRHQHSTNNLDLPKAGNEQSISPTESVIPRFSELSVENKEKVLKRQPSVVIHKNPSAVYKNVVLMCCSILQSLLPDLDVSLSKEFVDFPHDLLSFIDSVIALNR